MPSAREFETGTGLWKPDNQRMTAEGLERPHPERHLPKSEK